MDRHQTLPPEMNPRLARSIRRSLAADQSSNMEEVLRADEGTNLPPAPTNIRVRNYGRTIKERGEVCQWIHDMTLEPPAPKGISAISAAGSKASLDISTAGPKTRKDEANETANAKLVAAAFAKAHGAALNASGTGDTAAAKVCSGLSHADAGKPVDPEQPAVEKTAGSGEESSFEDQLNEIRQQQLQLLERQRAIQEQLDKRQGSSTGSSSCGVTVIEQKHGQTGLQGDQDGPDQETTAITQSQFTLGREKAAGVEIKRRRLKGSLASHYARRDEGTVASLLWSPTASDANSSSVARSNSTLCVSAGRQANLRQDNSSSISALLSQTSFLESRSFHGSDTSETCPHAHQSHQDKEVSESIRCSVKPALARSSSKQTIDRKPETEKNESAGGENDCEYVYSLRANCETPTA
ncbi:hypothetical protein ElyMa_006768800 [Elysia marginata]|uniref:Uncharacterized protein n=1 Tax=Elysia marginata TaxID=1093978 RepID=A0AAV4IXT4_9GAST|nr:hypothetical protein ElyMa_006768800 [Elysia marginata]